MNRLFELNNKIRQNLNEIINSSLASSGRYPAVIPIETTEDETGALIYHICKLLAAKNGQGIRVYSQVASATELFYYRICVDEDYMPEKLLNDDEWECVKSHLSVIMDISAPICYDWCRVQSISQLSRYRFDTENRIQWMIFDMRQLNIPRNNRYEIINQTNQLADLAKEKELTVLALYSTEQMQILRHNMTVLSTDGILSVWNGFMVHGDARELDRISESEGYINLDKEDIVNTLSTAGSNYITTGSGINPGDALTTAIANLPVAIGNASGILIQFYCGNRRPGKSDLAGISEALKPAHDKMSVRWGLATDASSGNDLKVAVLASFKPEK